MATVFDLPPLDVLFTHIFGYLETLDIWRLRLVCRGLHNLCWDYFTNVCTSLSVNLYPVESTVASVTSELRLGAGITILRKCKKVRSLSIEGKLAGKSNGFREVLSAVIDSDTSLLRRLCFSYTDFSTSVVPLMDKLSLKCCRLEELELCGVVADMVSVQWILSCLLQHSKSSLQKLSIEELKIPPSHQLPITALSGLRHFSVSLGNALCYNYDCVVLLLIRLRIAVMSVPKVSWRNSFGNVLF